MYFGDQRGFVPWRGARESARPPILTTTKGPEHPPEHLPEHPPSKHLPKHPPELRRADTQTPTR